MDSVLIAHFPKFKRKFNVLDLGTGTGVIPLLIADEVKKISERPKNSERPKSPERPKNSERPKNPERKKNPATNDDSYATNLFDNRRNEKVNKKFNHQRKNPKSKGSKKWMYNCKTANALTI